MLPNYDVIVVGMGPAGGQCARELARQGKKILLVDKIKAFNENSFSSGGAPGSIMQDFALPSSLAGSYWETLRICSTKEKVKWQFPKSTDPILDFEKLREFLAKETSLYGSEYRLGYHYHSHIVMPNGVEVSFKDLKTQEEKKACAEVLVDATGTDRKVINKRPYNKDLAMAITGIEYHIQVDPIIYERFNHSMNFFLGHKWMPQGYAWIFSMAPYQLKVGVVRYFQDHSYVPHASSYQTYLEQLIQFCTDKGSYKITEKHGKTIFYTLGQKDVRYQGPVIAIGDAISAINPLGCEGIRHALASGRLAALAIDKYLNNEIQDFKGYDNALKGYFGKKWFLSELMMKSLFKQKNDHLIDLSVKSFGLMNNEEILDVIFNYRFSHTLKSYFWYFTSQLVNFFVPEQK